VVGEAIDVVVVSISVVVATYDEVEMEGTVVDGTLSVTAVGFEVVVEIVVGFGVVYRMVK
jgi:hypothetical protein